MDGILPPQAAPSAQPQLQHSGLEAQSFTANQQAKLPIGTVITAMVLGNDKNGNLLVRVNGSDLLLSSPLALAKGAQLQIRLDSIGGNITASLLSVDGKLPVGRPQENALVGQKPGGENSTPSMRLLQVLPEGLAKIAPQQTYNMQAALRVDTVSLSSNPANAVMKALVIQPSPQIMQYLRAGLTDSGQGKSDLFKSLPLELKAGTEASVKLTNIISQPKSPPAQNHQPIDTQNRALKGQDWMKTSSQPISELMQNFSPDIKQAASKNFTMNAMVVDSKANGEMLVESKLGLIRVDGKMPYAKGTELMLEIMGFKPPVNAEESENLLQQLTKEWPALKNAVEGNKAEAQKIAGTENNFGLKLTKFLNAVASNNPEGWLGTEFLETMDDAARDILISKLKNDFAALRNLSADQSSGWQSFLFPIFDGRELNQARLHVKNFKNTESEFESAGTRFVVELETSYYGEMQFDGLIRKSLPRKHFDLIIRTHDGIDDETRRKIHEIFITAQQLAGFIGNLEFAANPQFPIEIWKDVLNKHSPHGSYIS